MNKNNMSNFFSIWFSTIFAIFLLSGIIKSTHSIFVVFDITFLSMANVVSLILLYVYFNGIKISRKIIGPMVILFLVFFNMTLSLYYTKSQSYSIEKTILSITNLVAFIAPLIYRVNTRVFSLVFIFISLIVAIVNVYMRTTLSWGELMDSSYARLYLNSGLACGFSFLLGCLYLKGQYKVFSLLILAVLLIILGSRGALLGLVLSLIFPMTHYIFTLKGFDLKKLILPAMVSLILITINFETISLNFERSIGRLELLFTEDGGRSVTERYEHIDNAITMFEEKPILGHGIGSYGSYTQGLDIKRYPHNIILEFMAELGVIGALLITLFFFSLFLIQKWSLLTYGILIFSMFNILKSYSFEDLRIFFGIISLTIVYEMNKKGCHEKNLHSSR